MQHMQQTRKPRTSADAVFDYLYEQIGSLELRPGAKISEAEIAGRFGVSRQPVRDAFSRLSNLDLLLVRPQKATVVKKFSLKSIEAARFVRLSVELEIMRKAAALWDGSLEDAFSANLAAQKNAAEARDVDVFHDLDYAFHRLLCQVAKSDFAFEIISKHKAQVDRLCVLSMTSEDSMRQLIEDHTVILDQLRDQNEEGLCQSIRMHLSRLDETISTIYRDHHSYFEH